MSFRRMQRKLFPEELHVIPEHNVSWVFECFVEGIYVLFISIGRMYLYLILSCHLCGVLLFFKNTFVFTIAL